MKPNQLATLVLRLLGIYCLIQVIPTISAFTTTVFFAQAPLVDGRGHALSNVAMIMVAILPLACRLVLGTLLLVRSATWGERLVPKDVGRENITAISFEQAQALAFAIAGILIFSDALPSLFRSIYNLINWFEIQKSHPELQSDYTWRNGLTAFGALVQAVLGLLLFFCSHGFVNFWRSLRNFGTPRPPEN